MEEETFFYCQECDGKITLDQLALLNEGKCPACGSLAGFSTQPKSESDGFEHLTMINDSELLAKSLGES
jgi:transcription initiation factor IIE alpha subunit